MFELLPLERQLLNRRKLRVVAIEMAIDGRRWHPEDPLKRELEGKLADAKNELTMYEHELKKSRDRLMGRTR